MNRGPPHPHIAERRKMTAPIAVDRGGFSLAAFVDGQPQGAPWIILSNSLGAAPVLDRKSVV